MWFVNEKCTFSWRGGEGNGKDEMRGCLEWEERGKGKSNRNGKINGNGNRNRKDEIRGSLHSPFGFAQGPVGMTRVLVLRQWRGILW